MLNEPFAAPASNGIGADVTGLDVEHLGEVRMGHVAHARGPRLAPLRGRLLAVLLVDCLDFV